MGLVTGLVGLRMGGYGYKGILAGADRAIEAIRPLIELHLAMATVDSCFAVPAKNLCGTCRCTEGGFGHRRAGYQRAVSNIKTNPFPLMLNAPNPLTINAAPIYRKMYTCIYAVLNMAYLFLGGCGC